MSLEKERLLEDDDWCSDWSWAKLVSILSHEDAPERRKLAGNLVPLMRTSFQRLRTAIEDPNCKTTTWMNPFLVLPYPISYDLETTAAISALNSRESRRERDLLVTLHALSGGAAFVHWGAKGWSPVLPPVSQRYFQVFSEQERKSYRESWVDKQKWTNPVCYGDDVASKHSRERTISGSTGEVHFSAALVYCVYPRVYDPANKRSMFATEVGLPWIVSDIAFSPEQWLPEECDALWKAIDTFLSDPWREGNGTAPPKDIIMPVQNNGGAGDRFKYFKARSWNHRNGVVDKRLRIPLIGETSLSHIPSYARGGQGPVLQISDGKSNLRYDAAIRLIATMLYPSCPERRSAIVAQGEALSFLESLTKQLAGIDAADNQIEEDRHAIIREPEGEIPILSRRALIDILNASSLKDFSKQHHFEFFRGIAAGDVLRFIASYAEHPPEKPVGVNKAVTMVAERMRQSRYPSGKQVSCGRSTIYDAWAKYKSVAHLWAAYRCWIEDFESGSILTPWEPNGLLNFLSLAEGFRKNCEMIFAFSQRHKAEPILNPAETWQLPTDLHLPFCQLSFDPPIQPARAGTKTSGRQHSR